MENIQINLDVENNYYPPEWDDHDIELFLTMLALYEDNCFAENSES